MSLDVYFKEDVANIIRSVNQAGGNTAALVQREIDNPSQKGVHFELAKLEQSLGLYQQGYRDALGAVAAAFGILPQ